MQINLKVIKTVCNSNNFQKALVTSIDRVGVKEIDDLVFSFLPASVYCYNIGDITLKMRNNA